MSKSILHLDLHPIAKNGKAIDDALLGLLEEANQKRVKAAEIIPGKGETVRGTVARGCQRQSRDNLNSRRRRRGQLMKRVKKFLDQKPIKTQYKRLEVDTKNHGRLFIHFR